MSGRAFALIEWLGRYFRARTLRGGSRPDTVSLTHDGGTALTRMAPTWEHCRGRCQDVGVEGQWFRCARCGRADGRAGIVDKV